MAKNIGVLVSGRGSNLQAIIDSIERGEIDGKISVVISNKKDAYGLERAKKHGIEPLFISHKKKTREEFEKELIEAMDARGVELVVLAGFMRVLTPLFVRHYKHRLINIHPAILPSFPGTQGQKDTLDYGCKVGGCTIHFVDEGVDTGPIIVQRCVEVKEDDTVETLAARILEQEHIGYPLAVKYYCEDRLKIEGRRVRILPEKK